mmetsp:Transcript_23199/g.77889  ORF Transcript_23199/g.77889 Transcript_23199/m.77889 type:complete len:504 (-) Transcript_23199:247-1758(-)
MRAAATGSATWRPGPRCLPPWHLVAHRHHPQTSVAGKPAALALPAPPHPLPMGQLLVHAVPCGGLETLREGPGGALRGRCGVEGRRPGEHVPGVHLPVAHHAHRVRRHPREGRVQNVEARVARERDALEDDEAARDEAEVVRDGEREAEEDGVQLVGHVVEVPPAPPHRGVPTGPALLKVAHRLVRAGLERAPQEGCERRAVHVRREEAQEHCVVHEARHVPLHGVHDGRGQPRRVRPGHLRAKAKVDQRQPPVPGDQEVPRVRVAVHKARGKRHVTKHAAQKARHGGGAQAGGAEGRGVPEGHAALKVHGEHPGPRELRVRLRHHHAAPEPGREARRAARRVGRLRAEVELEGQVVAHLVHEPLEAKLREGEPHEGHEGGERGHLRPGGLPQARVLHLHCDRAATGQPSAVHLGQGGRGDGLVLETVEGLFHGHPQVRGNHAARLPGRRPRGPVEQRLQRAEVGLWHEVVQQRHVLAQLDVDAPVGLAHAAEALPAPGVRGL